MFSKSQSLPSRFPVQDTCQTVGANKFRSVAKRIAQNMVIQGIVATTSISPELPQVKLAPKWLYGVSLL